MTHCTAWRASHFVAALALVGLVFAQDASAEPSSPVSVQLRDHVQKGAGPLSIAFRADEPLRNLTVTITADDITPMRFKTGRMKKGQIYRHEWSPAVGARTYHVEFEARRKSGVEPFHNGFDFEGVVLEPLSLGASATGVDLEKRCARLVASRPAKELTVSVRSPGSSEGETVRQDASGLTPGKPFSVCWKTPADKVGALIIHIEDQWGNWAEARVTPWSVEIPHEEVNFAFGKAEIRGGERPKLDHACERIRKALAEHGHEMKASLYVGGFTDTVGSPSSNLELSEKRARAIAGYFRSCGVDVPILFAGFGESLLAVPTPDETPAEGNRRAVYVLSNHMPRLGGEPGRGWRPL